MRVIKLTHGPGNGVDSACLMTASNMLIGRGEDGDNNSCVCPVLRSFIIKTNDSMPVELLGELYGPLAWEILGTRTDDPEIERQRAYAFADWAVREIAPIALRDAGMTREAESLESLLEIKDKESADAAYAAARAASAVADAAYAAARAASAVANAASAVAKAAKAANAADAAADAADAAADAAWAANAANAARAWRKCPEIIRRVAAIGDKRPVECVITADQLADCLNK